MRQTYLTTMKSEAGAFLRATRIIAKNKGNITRVNYNKSVDEHTLFIDVEADEQALVKITEELTADGFLTNAAQHANVVLVEFKLKDVSGALLPVLEIIEKYDINITYINSEENKTGYQYFKMGLFIDEPSKIKQLLDEVADYASTRIIEYDPTEKILDNTVFYLSFANEIAETLNLNTDEKKAVILESNKIMQTLDEKNESPYKTFEYINRFAELVGKAKGSGFNPRITQRILDERILLYLIEPPCGSNTYILEKNDNLLFIDCGFACYKKEMNKIFKTLFDNFDSRKKEMILTHPDTDHIGLIDMFDKVYLSNDALIDLTNRKNGFASYREQNPVHAPYSRLCDILTDHVNPKLDNTEIIDWNILNANNMDKIGQINFEGINFDIYKASGGHVKGEILIFCEKYSLIFTGDVFVNIDGYSPEQSEFNKIAPFLMTNVDTDSVLAKAFRKQFLNSITGKPYTICGGHGAFYAFEG